MSNTNPVNKNQPNSEQNQKPIPRRLDARKYMTTADRKRAEIDFLTEKAFRVLKELMDDPAPAIRLGAAKESLDRTLGRPRQSAELSINSTDYTALHLAALRELASRPTQAIDLIDVTPERKHG